MRRVLAATFSQQWIDLPLEDRSGTTMESAELNGDGREDLVVGTGTGTVSSPRLKLVTWTWMEMSTSRTFSRFRRTLVPPTQHGPMVIWMAIAWWLSQIS